MGEGCDVAGSRGAARPGGGGWRALLIDAAAGLAAALPPSALFDSVTGNNSLVAGAAGVTVSQIGVAGGDIIRVEDVLHIAVEELRDVHEGWMPGFMTGGT